MDNKIAVLKIPSYKIENRADSAIIVIKLLCILKGIKLSNVETYTLAHFMCEGYNQITKEQLVEGKLLKDIQALANVLSSLRKNGILTKNLNRKEVLTPDFNFPITEKIKIDIMLDNS